VRCYRWFVQPKTRLPCAPFRSPSCSPARIDCQSKAPDAPTLTADACPRAAEHNLGQMKAPTILALLALLLAAGSPASCRQGPGEQWGAWGGWWERRRAAVGGSRQAALHPLPRSPPHTMPAAAAPACSASSAPERIGGSHRLGGCIGQHAGRCPGVCVCTAGAPCAIAGAGVQPQDCAGPACATCSCLPAFKAPDRCS
jgi:hypothetical protein